MTTFDITGKIAIVTGGASGLGYHYVDQLLEKGAKGVTIADISEENGRKVSQEYVKKYSKNKILFVKTDVTNYEDFDNVFRVTIEKFGNIDILINNAGIFDDQNFCSREVDINLKGTIHGTMLALDKYIPKHKTGSEGVVINVSSIAGIQAFGGVPGYTATKFAVHGLTLAWGLPGHYERTGVKVVGICPGVTTTPLIQNFYQGTLSQYYTDLLKEEVDGTGPTQLPEHVAVNLMKIIEKAASGTIWVVENGESPYKFEIPERSKITKICL